MTDNEYLTRAQTAEILGVSTRTVDRYASQGVLPKFTRLKGVVFRAADVRALAVPTPR